MEILERELDEFTEQLHSELEGIDDPRERLEQFFRCYVKFGEENEFIQQVFIQQDYRDVLGDISAIQLAEIERKEMEALFPLSKISKRNVVDRSRRWSRLLFLDSWGSLGMMVLHKDEYEEFSANLEIYQKGIYYHFQEAMISILARGLTIKE